MDCQAITKLLSQRTPRCTHLRRFAATARSSRQDGPPDWQPAAETDALRLRIRVMAASPIMRQPGDGNQR
jgi:hypothetical protein